MKIILDKLITIAKDGTEETIPMEINNWKKARDEAHQIAYEKNGPGSGYVLMGGLACGIIITGPEDGKSVPMWGQLRELSKDERKMHDAVWAAMEREMKISYGVKDVANHLGVCTASVRAKAGELAKKKALNAAYKNSNGWQITRRGVRMMENWPDGRRK